MVAASYLARDASMGSRSEARWREETAGVLLTTPRSHADGSTTSRRSKPRRDTYRRGRTCGRGRRTDAVRQEGARPGSPSPPRHSNVTRSEPSNMTMLPRSGSEGGRASCAPLNGALVGAVRGRIRNAVDHTPDLASGANGAEHRVVS